MKIDQYITTWGQTNQICIMKGQDHMTPTRGTQISNEIIHSAKRKYFILVTRVLHFLSQSSHQYTSFPHLQTSFFVININNYQHQYIPIRDLYKSSFQVVENQLLNSSAPFIIIIICHSCWYFFPNQTWHDYCSHLSCLIDSDGRMDFSRLPWTNWRYYRVS